MTTETIGQKVLRALTSYETGLSAASEVVEDHDITASSKAEARKFGDLIDNMRDHLDMLEEALTNRD